MMGTGFKKLQMTRWFSVPQLAATGMKALISTIFGNYADKRELQANIPMDTHDYSERDEIWIDFLSDTGDGFDPTYTMASLMAKDNLTFGDVKIPRGKILIMGGDQVYPTPGKKEYLQHLQIPFNAAFPWREEDADRPHLFAIPGNHDWYDGLSSFLKLFCQGRALGNWHSQQKRSYFAIQLPHNIWFWGIDNQLQADIDTPQLCYFEEISTKYMKAGDKVILCTAEPSWVYEATTDDSTSYDRFNFFVRRFFNEKGYPLLAILTGDLHHYSRYGEQLPGSFCRQYITAGGGGAFMHATHVLPNNINLQRSEEVDGAQIRKTLHLKLEKTFPDKKDSKQLLFRNVLFPFQNFSMALLIGVIHLLALWILQSGTAYQHPSFLQSAASATSFGEFFRIVSLTLIHAPAVVILNLVVFFGILSFTDTAGGKYKRNYIAGAIHGLFHVISFYALIWLFSVANCQFASSVGNITANFLYIPEMLLVGSTIHGLIFGLYLILCNLLLGSQAEEAYSALRIKGYKNFLRICISSEGVTIYPVGVRKVVTNWTNSGTDDKPSFTGGEIRCELIEDPVVIKFN